MPGLRPWLALLAGLALQAGCAQQGTARMDGGVPRGPAGSFAIAHGYGVLLADPTNLSADSAAGVRWAEVETRWDQLEPSPGQFDAGAIPLADIQQFRDAGWKVELSFGLHEAPPWATMVEPWVDQDGGAFTDQANWFNAAIQQHVSNVIHEVLAVVGPGNVDAIRIGGLTSAGELLYPVTPPYHYVAYSASALAGTPLIPPNPVPRCRPPSCSAQDAELFLGWYVDALGTFGNFQVAAARDAGFMGDVQWLMPGVGIRPDWRTLLVNNGLDLSRTYPDDFQISAGGAEWPRLMGDIQEAGPRTVIDCTSLDDSSAASANEASSNVDDWSSAHWLAYNADLHGFRKCGENQGGDAVSGMDLAFQKLGAYGYQKLMWAFDGELRDGVHATLADYAAHIQASP